MNEVIQTLQDCGLRVEPGSTPLEVTTVLMKADEDNLWKAFDSLCGDCVIGFDAEESVQRAVVAYALSYAVEHDLESIDQEIVDTAMEKSSQIFDGIKPDKSQSNNVQKRTRTPHLRAELLQYIKDNPDQTKHQVVDEFMSRYPDKAVNTLGQYYHSCRKEAGLTPNGTPGRKKGDTFDLVKAIVIQMTQENPNVSVSELKDAVLNNPDIDLSPPSVQVYVYRARSNIQT